MYRSGTYPALGHTLKADSHSETDPLGPTGPDISVSQAPNPSGPQAQTLSVSQAPNPSVSQAPTCRTHKHRPVGSTSTDSLGPTSTDPSDRQAQTPSDPQAQTRRTHKHRPVGPTGTDTVGLSRTDPRSPKHRPVGPARTVRPVRRVHRPREHAHDGGYIPIDIVAIAHTTPAPCFLLRDPDFFFPLWSSPSVSSLVDRGPAG